MPKPQYLTHWCSLLSFHLRRRLYSAAHFGTLVNLSQQMVHNYLSGKTRPPIGKMNDWARALGLSHQEEHQFLQAAYEAWTPAPIWERLVELESANPPPASLAHDQLNILRAQMKDCVEILQEIEGLFYLRNVPIGEVAKRRRILEIALRNAIQRYRLIG